MGDVQMANTLPFGGSLRGREVFQTPDVKGIAIPCA